MVPQHKHDCDTCKFLGVYGEFDLYYCPNGGPTIIARFGSLGPDYTSGLSFGERNFFECKNDTQRAMRIAYLIAQDSGFNMVEK